MACGRQKPGSLSEIDNATPADSMMYFLGEMVASQYWQDAESDTTLRTEEARREFLNGVRAVVEPGEKSSAYYRGVEYGLNLARNLRKYHKRYDMEYPREIALSAIENGLKGDNRDSILETQKGFYQIKDLMEYDAATRELREAKVALANAARERGFEMVSDTLYALDVTGTGKGRKYRDGDRVAVEVTASTLDGREIVARQFPDSLTIGAGRVPRVVCLGIHTMTDGQTRKFMTTPRTLFGKRYRTYHLPYEEPVIFTVKVTN